MIYCHIFVFIVLWFLYRTTEMKEEKRNKRILYGNLAEDADRDAYSVFRYYVFLAKGDIVDDPSWWRRWWHGTTPSPNELVCGGALLTPKIVQTACHCLAKYNRFKPDNFTYASPLNVWEDRIYSFVGSNEVSRMYDMLVPKHYVVYQQCHQLLFGLSFSMMDFGLVVTKDSVDKKSPKAAISYAPMYNGEIIKKYYYRAIKKEYMCLHIGHGYWSLFFDSNYDLRLESQASEYQRWGWRTVMNYMDCLSATYPQYDRQRTFFFNYTAEATWVCFKFYKEEKKWNYNYGEGDSGGPVTCNGVYFAVVTSSESIEAENVLSYASPIAYTTFENSVEYRNDFIIWCDSIGDVAFPFNHFTVKKFIPTPPSINIRTFSQRSLATIHHHLFILPTTLFVSFYLT